MSPVSEESLVLELAAAVLSANRRKPKPSQDHLDWGTWALYEEDVHAVERALDGLLYRHGSDGVYVRTVSDDGAGHITIVGFNIWVDFSDDGAPGGNVQPQRLSRRDRGL